MLVVSAILFLASIIIATRISAFALSALSADEKVRLVDLAAKTPIFGFLLLAAVVAAWLAICYFRPWHATEATIICLAVILLMSVVSAVTLYRKLQSAGMPAAFLRSFAISRGLRLLGAGVFFITMLLWLIGEMAQQAN